MTPEHNGMASEQFAERVAAHLAIEHPKIQIINIQHQPVLILVDSTAGIPPETWHHMAFPKESPLRGLPVLYHRPGTRIEVLDVESLAQALSQLPTEKWVNVIERMAEIICSA